MNTTPPEATGTETSESEDYYTSCTAVANYLLGDYTGVSARCQEVKGSHDSGHWNYSRSSIPTNQSEPKFKDVVTLRVAWPGDYEG